VRYTHEKDDHIALNDAFPAASQRRKALDDDKSNFFGYDNAMIIINLCSRL